MNEKIKGLIDEIDGLVAKIDQSDDEPSQEVLDSIEELTAEVNLLKEKKLVDNSKELITKLDQLIEVIHNGDKLSTETTKSIVEAVKQIKLEAPKVSVEAPKVEVNVPEVKVPPILPPEVNIPPTIVNFPDEFDVKKPSWIENLINLDPILKAIGNLTNAIVNFSLPRDAKDAIPVRLSNGEKFYNAIGGMASAIAGAFPFKKSDSSDQAALVSENGTQYTYIQQTIPTHSTKINTVTYLDKNAGGDLIKIRKVIDGVTYTKTFSSDDMVVSETQTISAWS